ncbi:hypothetical protein Tco_1252225 [Tanacetum coccineum]
MVIPSSFFKDWFVLSKSGSTAWTSLVCYYCCWLLKIDKRLKSFMVIDKEDTTSDIMIFKGSLDYVSQIWNYNLLSSRSQSISHLLSLFGALTFSLWFPMQSFLLYLVESRPRSSLMQMRIVGRSQTPKVEGASPGRILEMDLCPIILLLLVGDTLNKENGEGIDELAEFYGGGKAVAEWTTRLQSNGWSIGKDQSSVLGSPSMVATVNGTSECDIGAPKRTTGSGRPLDESHRLQRVGSKGPPSEYKFLGNCEHVCQHCGALFWYEEQVKALSTRTRP